MAARWKIQLFEWHCVLASMQVLMDVLNTVFWVPEIAKRF
jgi:hypothetical protein